jgi:serine/threonine protein kinase
LGTLHWLPPEIIKAKTDKNAVYTISADIWSFGILAIELANREPPNFENQVEDEILNEILEMEIDPKPLGEKWSD